MVLCKTLQVSRGKPGRNVGTSRSLIKKLGALIGFPYVNQNIFGVIAQRFLTQEISKSLPLWFLFLVKPTILLGSYKVPQKRSARSKDLKRPKDPKTM